MLTSKLLAITACLLAALPALAQTTAPRQGAPNSDQVIVPQVERRDVQRPKYPSNDFSLTLYGGTYSTQNFGSSGTGGVRLGYHVTEDVFVEAAYGTAKVSDEAFRRVLPGGIFVNPKEKLEHYNVSAGYNLLVGEAFFGRSTAKATQGYVVVGIGSTQFRGQKMQTTNVGFGLRLILNHWFAIQADVRDHVYSQDLLGKRESTHNPEVTVGLTVLF
jgi:outer membrane beta-barrel protein